MTSSLHSFGRLFVAAVLSVSSFASAQAADYESLFNGTDLKGWKGLEKFWTVVDGAIVGETTKENPTTGNTFLVWQGGDVEDFDLTCQVRFRGNNSGVQYRSKLIDAEKFVVAGYQCDLHPLQANFGMLYGEKMDKRGIIAKRNQVVAVDAEGKVAVQGEIGGKTEFTDWAWNEVRITAVGKDLVHRINGEPTVWVNDAAPNGAAKGIVALQLHAGPPMRVEFKDIKLRRLTPAEGKALLNDLHK